MEQSLADVSILRGILSSITGMTTTKIDGFIETYMVIRAYGLAHSPQLVPEFVAAVTAGVATASFATLLDDLTTALDTGFMLIVVRIKVAGQRQTYEHHGLWGPETQSRVRP